MHTEGAPKTMKKLLLGVLAAVLIGVGVYTFVSQNQPKPTDPDDIFTAYLHSTAKINPLAQAQTISGTGARFTSSGFTDANKKEVRITTAMKCTGTVDDHNTTLEATLVNKNADYFVRIDKFSGSLVNTEGRTFDLARVFSHVAGKWYIMNEDYTPAQSQLDSGVFVYSSAIIAPGHDTNKLVDSLRENNALTYTNFKETDDGYAFDVTATRTHYRRVLQEVFPDLEAIDLVLDEVFIDSDTKTSTITTDKSGNFRSETTTVPNICGEFMHTLLGEEVQGIASSVTGEAKRVDMSEVDIIEAIDAKQFRDIQSDYILD